MTNILITGHSVGNDLDLCQSCGFDYEWLFLYPSTLLWADKILITKSTWDFITGKNSPPINPFEKSAKLVFELLLDSNLVEVFDPTEIIDAEAKRNIVSTVEIDVKRMAQHIPDIVRIGDTKKVPGEFFIQNDKYCSPYMYSVYASLLLAKVMDAQCLFNSKVLKYCNVRFGMNAGKTTQSIDQ